MSASDDLSGKNTTPERTPEMILAELRAISDDIVKKRRELATEGSKTYELGVEIQMLKKARGTIKAELAPLTMAYVHPNPETLPVEPKMTRNELRRFMGFYGPWEDGEI